MSYAFEMTPVRRAFFLLKKSTHVPQQSTLTPLASSSFSGSIRDEPSHARRTPLLIKMTAWGRGEPSLIVLMKPFASTAPSSSEPLPMVFPETRTTGGFTEETAQQLSASGWAKEPFFTA